MTALATFSDPVYTGISTFYKAFMQPGTGADAFLKGIVTCWDLLRNVLEGEF
jgi:hypothetical protein